MKERASLGTKVMALADCVVLRVAFEPGRRSLAVPEVQITPPETEPKKTDKRQEKGERTKK
jgi:hypothetical protein